jgi:pSer/pThr/pTyr-binding forkhead associated (FHA) protein
MKSLPVIVVQLVHIHGPLKGEIQELSESPISIGRRPTCQLQFPKDLIIVSRNHAQIVREGNRFRLIDQSANGTFVNGKRVKEVYLKDGDVLVFSEGGPKVSFLTKIMESQDETEDVTLPSPPEEPEMPGIEKSSMAHAKPEQVPGEEISIQKVQVPLIIQYGPTLRSFKELPVTFGKNPDCDFTLDHPAMLGRHGQFFFSKDQYWVKDLTGQKLISIDGQPVHFQAPLKPNNRLDLSPRGPNFRFLGEGRLAEVEEPVPEEAVNASHEKEEISTQGKHEDRNAKKRKSLFKKLLQR